MTTSSHDERRDDRRRATGASRSFPGMAAGRRWCAAAALVAAACGGRSPAPIGNVGGGAIGHVHDDVDGDGTPDTVTLAGRTVTMGKVSLQLPDDVGAETARVVDLGPAAYVAIESTPEDEEDATPEWALFAWQGGALVLIGYTPAGELPGDGTVRAESSNCGQETTYVYRVVDGAMTLDEDATVVAGIYREDECAACPHVLVATGGRLHFVGEALRNLSSPTLEAEDALPLPPVDGQRELVVVLAEVKPETTYLDSLVVDFGGARVSPRACVGAACAVDGRYEVFSAWERRRFVFDVPAGFVGVPVLYARGYYVRFTSTGP